MSIKTQTDWHKLLLSDLDTLRCAAGEIVEHFHGPETLLADIAHASKKQCLAIMLHMLSLNANPF